MSSGSATAVYAAICGNTVVMVAKFIAFALTGSGAMLSEGIHSFADVSNQALLALGISRSRRKPDPSHPYGYGAARFVWALISAVGIFFVGCGVTIYHGVTTLLHPHPIESGSVALGVLIFSFLIEGATLAVAVRAVTQDAHKQGLTLWGFIREGTDPTGVAVLLEDFAACLGILIAAGAIGLTALTGDPVWDSIGSIVIGLLLGLVAIFLVDRNRVALLGSAAPEKQRSLIVRVLENDPVVESVHDVKATVLGVEGIRFKAEIEFDGEELARRWLSGHPVAELKAEARSDVGLHALLVRYGDHLIDFLGDEIDRLEADIKRVVPQARHVDIEAD